ncbi:hypothetical protein [Sharpea azabuensis]|uniref:hypothetical protein n=1 Tax=Sharpea azabuensis TaxID=322505 RepID=UPI003D06A67E
MDNNEKVLQYSIKVSYLGILLRENLITEEEYKKCLIAFKMEYGIVFDIIVDL